MRTAVTEGESRAALCRRWGQAAPVFERFARHRYVVLHTFRRKETSVDTQVWFALGKDEVDVVTTKHSGKVIY